MTNHVCFNLDGDQGVRQHQLQILAQRYSPVESDGIPGGEQQDVANTSFDFASRKPSPPTRDADQQKVKGYDHAFPLMPRRRQPPAAQVWSQDGKRR
jgi:aldose 1-epimerase